MIDVESVKRFLHDMYTTARSIHVEGVHVVAGGYSEETFASDCRIDQGQRGVEELKLILRRDPPPQTDILPTSRLNEHLLLRQIAAHTSIPVPRALFLDARGEFFKRPTMVMERVPGSSNLSALFGGEDADQLEFVATHLCECLAELHTTSIEKLDPHGALADPRQAGIETSNWHSYMASMLAYFKSNYTNIATPCRSSTMPTPAFRTAFQGQCRLLFATATISPRTSSIKMEKSPGSSTGRTLMSETHGRIWGCFIICNYHADRYDECGKGRWWLSATLYEADRHTGEPG